MQLSDFDYDLPTELIAQHPCAERDACRLMVLDGEHETIEHRHFFDIGDYLRPGDTLVFNDTKVIPARLIGAKHDTGGKVEVFLLARREADDWEVLVKPGKKARPGAVIDFGEELSCEVLSTTDFGGRIVRFKFAGIFEEILDRLGETPLPPYIKEKLQNKDSYQTVYAREKGSAAAPTAGLHFTRNLMDRLAAKGVNLAFVTLHVGLGTFRPVHEKDITQHIMHREYYSVSQETADIVNATRKHGGRIIAVGTTAVRTLETAAGQDGLQVQSGWTEIFIYPGYKYKLVDGLITNFHLPQSTLLMLVSALMGREYILRAYNEAVKARYRFFSFGDAMCCLVQQKK